MSDFDAYDEDPKRRKRRHRRNIDDAWGMAEYEDYADGNFADAEDYAAGMVDEESAGGRVRAQYVSGADESDSYAVTGSEYSPSQSWANPDGAVDRAANLMDRFNRRNSYNQPTALPPRQRGGGSAPAGDSPFDTLFNVREASPLVLGIMVVMGGCAFSCLLLIIYLALG